MRHELNEKNDYVIVPDIHGEYRVFKNIIDKYSQNKFILLGDIVNRGESSYKTFYMVKELIESERAVSVVGNHDNKFYRWLLKWNNNKIFNKSHVPNYGMRLTTLEGTVKEFMALSDDEKIKYCDDFINYYNNTPLFLKLEKNNKTHYFCHAGLSRNVILGNETPEDNIESFIYHAVDDAYIVEMIFLGSNIKDVCVHVGHNWCYNTPTLFTSNDKALYMHDIGIGKRVIKNIPDLVIV